MEGAEEHSTGRVTAREHTLLKVVESEIYVLGWQPVDFTAKFTPFTNRVGRLVLGKRGYIWAI